MNDEFRFQLINQVEGVMGQEIAFLPCGLKQKHNNFKCSFKY